MTRFYMAKDMIAGALTIDGIVTNHLSHYSQDVTHLFTHTVLDHFCKLLSKSSQLNGNTTRHLATIYLATLRAGLAKF